MIIEIKAHEVFDHVTNLVIDKRREDTNVLGADMAPSDTLKSIVHASSLHLSGRPVLVECLRTDVLLYLAPAVQAIAHMMVNMSDEVELGFVWNQGREFAVDRGGVRR